jgi:hypothetical protein
VRTRRCDAEAALSARSGNGSSAPTQGQTAVGRGAASDRRCGSGVGIDGGSFRVARKGGAVAPSI